MSKNREKTASDSRKLIATAQALHFRWEDAKKENPSAFVLVRAGNQYVTFSEDADMIGAIIPRNLIEYHKLQENGCYLPDAQNRDILVEIITKSRAILITEDILSTV